MKSRCIGRNPQAKARRFRLNLAADLLSKQYDNFVLALGTALNTDVQASILAQLDALSKRRKELEGERDMRLSQRNQWTIARERLSDLRAWCVAMATRLRDATYEDKQLSR